MDIRLVALARDIVAQLDCVASLAESARHDVKSLGDAAIALTIPGSKNQEAAIAPRIEDLIGQIDDAELAKRAALERELVDIDALLESSQRERNDVREATSALSDTEFAIAYPALVKRLRALSARVTSSPRGHHETADIRVVPISDLHSERIPQVARIFAMRPLRAGDFELTGRRPLTVEADETLTFYLRLRAGAVTDLRASGDAESLAAVISAAANNVRVDLHLFPSGSNSTQLRLCEYARGPVKCTSCCSDITSIKYTAAVCSHDTILLSVLIPPTASVYDRIEISGISLAGNSISGRIQLPFTVTVRVDVAGRTNESPFFGLESDGDELSDYDSGSSTPVEDGLMAFDKALADVLYWKGPINVRLLTRDQCSLLHYAASVSAHILKDLITRGACVDECTSLCHPHPLAAYTYHDNNSWCGLTPLHCVVINPTSESITQITEATAILLDAGAFVDATSMDGMTPLHIASLNSAEPVVRALVSAGADVNALDGKGNTALANAFSPRNMGILYYDRTTILDSLSVASFLVEHGAMLNPAYPTKSPLAAAFRARNTPGIRMLVNKGADVNYPFLSGIMPLHAVLQAANDINLIRFLVRAGASLSYALPSTGRTPLHEAAYAPWDSVYMLMSSVDALLSAGAATFDVTDSRGLTPAGVLQQRAYRASLLHVQPENEITSIEYTTVLGKLYASATAAKAATALSAAQMKGRG